MTVYTWRTCELSFSHNVVMEFYSKERERVMRFSCIDIVYVYIDFFASSFSSMGSEREKEKELEYLNHGIKNP